MYAGGLMSPMQRRFSDLVCQPLVTSYVIDAYLCLAMLHAWTVDTGVPAHDALRLMVDTKVESQWPAGEDHCAALATFGSTRFRRMPIANALLLSTLWRSEIARDHGAT